MSLRDQRRRRTSIATSNPFKTGAKDAPQPTPPPQVKVAFQESSAPNPFGSTYDPYAMSAPSYASESNDNPKTLSRTGSFSGQKGKNINPLAAQAGLTDEEYENLPPIARKMLGRSQSVRNPRGTSHKPIPMSLLVETGDTADELEKKITTTQGSETPSAMGDTDKGVFLKVKFNGIDYPFDLKVLNLDRNCTISQAILVIQRSYKLPYNQSIGLYSHSTSEWLDDRTKLKDIDPIKLEDVEYRDRKAAVALGDTKTRRKTISLSKGTASPFFSNFINDFQKKVAESTKKKDDEQKRQQYLSSAMSGQELKETQSKLNKLAAETPKPKQEKKRSMSASAISAKNEQKHSVEMLMTKLQQKEQDAKLAAEIGQDLLRKNNELLNEINDVRHRESDIRKKYESLEGEFIRMNSKCMVLESQMSEAAQMNDYLLSQVDMNAEKFARLKDKMRELSGTEEKDRIIHERQEEIESYKKEIAKLRDSESVLKKKLQKLKEENEKIEDSMYKMKDELTDAKHGLEEYNQLKNQAKYLSQRNHDLEKKVKKITSEHLFSHGSALTHEKMMEILRDALRGHRLVDQNKEEDSKLLETAEYTIGSLRDAISDTDEDTTVFKELSRNLEKAIEREQELARSESPINNDDEEEIHVNSVYFIFALLLLAKQQQLERRLHSEMLNESAFNEDIEELRVKLEHERKNRTKIEEQLEVAERSKEQEVKEQIELFKKEMEELTHKKQDEIAQIHSEDTKKIQELEALLEATKKQCVALQTENSTLQNKLAIADLSASEVERLEDEVANLIKQLEAARRQSGSSQEELNNLRNQLAQLTASLEEKENSNQTLSSDNQRLQEEINKLRIEIQELRDQLAAARGELANSKESLDKLARDMEAEKANNQRLSEQLSQQNEAVERMQLEILEERENASNTSKLLEQERNKNALLSSQSSDDVQRLSRDIEDEKNKNQALSQQVSELNNRVGELTSKSETLEREIEDEKKKNKELNDTLERELALKNELSNQLTQQQQAHEQATSEMRSKHQSELDSLIKSYSEQIEAEKAINEELRKNIAQLTESNESLNGQIKKHVADYETLSAEKAKFEDDSRERLNQKDGIIASQQNEIENLQRTVAETETSAKLAQDQLRQTLEETVRNVESLQQTVSGLSKEKEELQAKNESQAKQIEELENTIKELREENEKLRKELQELKDKPPVTVTVPVPVPQPVVKIMQSETFHFTLSSSVVEVLEMNSLTPEESRYIDYINRIFGNEQKLSHRIPIGYKHKEVVDNLLDGIVLCSLINKAVPGTIDERVIKLHPKNQDHITENQNLLTNSALGIGVRQERMITSEDFSEGRVTKIIAFIAEVIEIIFMSKISLEVHPEIIVLMNKGEEHSSFTQLLPEDYLLRWFNYHLSKSTNIKPISNFGPDLKDSTKLVALLSQLDGNNNSISLIESENDLSKRAEMVISVMDKLGVREFVIPDDIVSGNARFTGLCLANIFHLKHGLKIPQLDIHSTSSHQQITTSNSSSQVQIDRKNPAFDDIGTREERAFRFWMNSLGVHVRNFTDDMKDGIALLKVIDAIAPDSVDWSRVTLKGNTFQKLENCSYAVSLVTSALRIPLVSIGGRDLYDGNKKLVLAIVWQLMRYHIVSLLKSLTVGNKEVTDIVMIDWANKKVEESGKPTRMQNFKDPTLRDSKFLIDLLNAVKPDSVDYELVTSGETDEESMLNAKYAISVARKIGCCIFLLWEDIVEVNAKMILTFVGTLISLANNGGKPVQHTVRKQQLERRPSFSRRLSNAGSQDWNKSSDNLKANVQQKH